jgi:hypothetical protein
MNEFDKSWCSVVVQSTVQYAVTWGTASTVIILNIGVSGFGSRYSFVCMLGYITGWYL